MEHNILGLIFALLAVYAFYFRKNDQAAWACLIMAAIYFK